jgi:hypothetical protein
MSWGGDGGWNVPGKVSGPFGILIFKAQAREKRDNRKKRDFWVIFVIIEK